MKSENEFKLDRCYEYDIDLLKREWLVVNMNDGSGKTYVNVKTGKLLKERFEYAYNVNLNINSKKLGFAKVKMKDGSGYTLFNPNTKELLDIRFNTMCFQNDNLWTVEMKDGSGWTLFNAETKELFNERFEEINLTDEHPGETLKKYKNTWVATLKESGETVIFDPKTHKITKEDFNPKDMFNYCKYPITDEYKELVEKVTSPKKVKKEFKKVIKSEEKSLDRK